LELLALRKIIRFRHRSRKGIKSPCRRLPMSNPHILQVVAVSALAIAGYAMVERPAQGVAGGGDFHLCASAHQQNCVVDGDTIRYGGVKIRLADIDAPEVFSPKCASEAARGKRATRRLLELMNAGPFQLVSGGRDEDRYGRKLRTIERAGRSLGATLVAEGLARPWDGARRSWCG
jgi:endonuclease YncB( thermonuclease family)